MKIAKPFHPNVLLYENFHFPMNKEAELFCTRNNTNKALLDVDKRGFLTDLACRGSIAGNSKQHSSFRTAASVL